ncbi:MAG TPA: hypothetical protein ENI70_00475, partial [Candidatus Peregrinibacteria bacterium]|nr:hypothetical protein [Candidatus Peregrinibacteria bacterium]
MSRSNYISCCLLKKEQPSTFNQITDEVMQALDLKAENRQLIRKGISNLRAQKLIPAILYGAKNESVSLQVDYQDFYRLFRKGGYNTIIDLQIGDKEKVKVLIQDIQFHPVKESV